MSNRIDSKTIAIQKNGPLRRAEIVPLHDVIQRTGIRKYITIQRLSLLAEEKGIKGITYVDLMTKFSCSKKQAQLKLKNAHSNLVLFTAGDLIDQGLEPPASLRNTKPQRYYSTAIKAEIIEKLKEKYKNVPLGTTVPNHSIHPPFKAA